ncbi:MAG: hypothetical protein WC796_06390 [Candidatus Pacearchaeota archaeon]|jgi:hypothetical protein
MKKRKLSYKEKEKIINKWIQKRGCCKFDLKNKEIILHDGALLCICSKNVRRHKVTGYKNLPNGYLEVLFSKNKPIKDKEYYADIWFEDVDELISYFKGLKRVLNSMGYKTGYKK